MKKEFELEETKEWFWTDNRVVIGYIKNDSRRFKTFVAKCNKSERILISTNGTMFQHNKRKPC